jgi:hypothetical protein
MPYGIYRVVFYAITAPFTLRVGFDDGTVRTIDLTPVLSGPLYGPLRDPTLFNSVKIDPEIHTLVWPNGADFDPETLHDWPELSGDFTAMVHRSEKSAAGCAEEKPEYDSDE